MDDVKKENIERVKKMVENAMVNSSRQEIIQHHPVARSFGLDGKDRIVRTRDYTITIKCYNYNPEGLPEERIWKTVPDEEVQHVWKCENEECPRHGVTFTVFPDYYQESGTPLCDQCDEDLVYQKTEVVLPCK